MVVISSAELRNNMKKYLDLATDEMVIIQRGKTETFVLTSKKQMPDPDLARAITKDELLKGIIEDINDIYAGKYSKSKTAVGV
jgi:hypothetical protein